MILNETLFRALNNLAAHSPAWSTVIIFLATTFSIIVIIITLVFLFWHKDRLPASRLRGQEASRINAWSIFRRRFSEVALVSSSAGTAWGLTKNLQYIFHQPRPFLALENINLLFQHGGFDSFPSGHATFFAALATAVFLRHRRAGAFLWICALLIGLARVASGVHFPSDIIAGFVLGATLPFLWSRIFHSS